MSEFPVTEVIWNKSPTSLNVWESTKSKCGTYELMIVASGFVLTTWRYIHGKINDW